MQVKKNRLSQSCLPMILIGSVLTAFTLIFPQVGLLEWLTMIPFCAGVYRLCEDDACTLKRAYGYGFLAVYAFYFVIYHWFVHLYPLDFVNLSNSASAVVVAAGWFGLPILRAAVGGFVFLLFRLLHRTGIFSRAPLVQPFALAALWAIFEWSATLTWAGVPWGRLCLGQIEVLPVLQSVSLFGSYFVSFLIVAVNGLLAYAILYGTRERLCGVLAVVLFSSNLLYGGAAMLLHREPTEPLRVAVIQGNMDSHDKWGGDAYYITTEIYGDLTRQAAAGGASLVVWPETAIPYDLGYEGYRRDFVRELAKECDVGLVVGAFQYDDEGNYYNALFYVEPDGTFHEDFYAKRHLVPFGEYVPMRDVIMTLIPPLAELSALDNDVTAGEGTALFDTEWGKIGSLICFDSIYEQLTRDSVRDGANLMVISSNDSWFYDSAAVYQHKSQGQLRAIESGRYVVRAANTGISTVVSPTGEILAWIDPLTKGYSIAEVEMRSQDTLYTVIGNLFVYLCIAFVALLLLIGKLMGKPRPREVVMRSYYGNVSGKEKTT